MLLLETLSRSSYYKSQRQEDVAFKNRQLSSAQPTFDDSFVRPARSPMLPCKENPKAQSGKAVNCP
jgi:hypothetical protein